MSVLTIFFAVLVTLLDVLANFRLFFCCIREPVVCIDLFYCHKGDSAVRINHFQNIFQFL